MKVVLCFFRITTMSSVVEPSQPGARHSPSGQPPAHIFPRALVHQLNTRAGSPHARPREAWVAFAYNLRWKYMESDAVSPRTLLDFRDHHCLVLDRLDAGATWADVEREVCPFQSSDHSRPALRVPGRLRGQLCKGAIVIVANSERERDDWLIALRVRIAPWQTLAQRATEVVRIQGPHSAIARDMCRTIYHQVAFKQPLTAESIPDVGAASHVEISAPPPILSKLPRLWHPHPLFQNSWRPLPQSSSCLGKGGWRCGDC